MSGTERLGPDDWTRAALEAIAGRGTAGVSVERLAKELGATKGSFYWHFKDRPALIAAALDHWEHRYTDAVIERLADVADPRERFRQLLLSSFLDQPGVVIDANLLAAADDPVVGRVLERVAGKRLAFVEQIFRDLDVPEAGHRAVLAFTAYVGLAQLRRTSPSLMPTGDRAAAYVDETVALLLGS